MRASILAAAFVAALGVTACAPSRADAQVFVMPSINTSPYAYAGYGYPSYNYYNYVSPYYSSYGWSSPWNYGNYYWSSSYPYYANYYNYYRGWGWPRYGWRRWW